MGLDLSFIKYSILGADKVKAQCFVAGILPSHLLFPTKHGKLKFLVAEITLPDFTLSLEKQILPKLLLSFNGKTLSFLMEYHTTLT